MQQQLITTPSMWASQVAPVEKNPPANARDVRDVSSIPGWRRSHEGRHGIPLQYSCLENTMDRGSWGTTIRRVAESHTTEATQQACTLSMLFSPLCYMVACKFQTSCSVFSTQPGFRTLQISLPCAEASRLLPGSTRGKTVLFTICLFSNCY